tara:strand:+ start:477 stop:719 length:243 start_codon:yes stop_codon:yes gene_type:complete
LQDSAPCHRCLSTIIELDIKRIVFSSSNNTFISCIPKELEINHISSGNRHLVKNSSYNKENDKKNNNEIRLIFNNINKKY